MFYAKLSEIFPLNKNLKIEIIQLVHELVHELHEFVHGLHGLSLIYYERTNFIY